VLRSGGDTSAAPIWDLAQWNTRFSIATAGPAPLANGGIQFTNEAKRIAVSTNGQLTLAVNAGVEYAGRARRKGEPWPHLLVSQRFAEHPSLAELREVVLQIAVRLRRSVAHPTPDDIPQLHAAQFLLYVTVQNLNRQSPGHGDFLYLGVPLYDNRRRSPKPYAAPDHWGKFIYTPAAEVYTKQSTHDGEWVTVKRDLLPLMEEGLRAAWDRGFLKHSRDLRDYRLGGMNLGWELPGSFDVEMEVKDLSLRATTKPPPAGS